MKGLLYRPLIGELYYCVCREASEQYCKQTQAILSQHGDSGEDSRTDPKAKLDSLYLAAAMNDLLSVRIAILAGVAVDTLMELRLQFWSFSALVALCLPMV